MVLAIFPIRFILLKNSGLFQPIRHHFADRHKPDTSDQQQAITEALHQLSEAIAGNKPLDYLKFRSLIPKAGLALDGWMIVCAAADLIEHKYQSQSSIIASDGSSLWIDSLRTV